MTPESKQAALYAAHQIKVMEILKSRHTKQLLDLLQSCRRCNGHYDMIGDNSPYMVTTAQVKAELATREHVPTKQESKEIRKAKKKAGK